MINIALVCDTNYGGARVFIKNLLSLLKGYVNFFYLSPRALTEIHVDISNRRFDLEWIQSFGVRICHSVKELPEDAILYEDNYSEFWEHEKTRDIVSVFKKRLCRNHVSWIPKTFNTEISSFIGNYTSTFLPNYILKSLSFKNIFSSPLYYNLIDTFSFLDKPPNNRKIDFITSYRINSNKMSKKLVSSIEDVFFCTDHSYVHNTNNSELMADHLGYINWMRQNVRGYLHYNDQWVETFGISLYEAIKSCDYVYYKPETYCDLMISGLPQTDQVKIIRISSVEDLHEKLLKKTHLQITPSRNIKEDIYSDAYSNRKRLLTIFSELPDS